MKIISKIIFLMLLVIAATSCSALSPKPTETSVPTSTSLPSLTFTPEPTITPTATVKPTKTPIPPTATPTKYILRMPKGEPVASWQGVAVMPGALAGEEIVGSYAYTIKASADEVQKFYEYEMLNLGWNMFASGQSENGAKLLMFMKGSGTFTVSILPQEEDLIYVLLIK